MTDKIVTHTPGPWHRDKYGNLLDANGRSVLFRSVSIAASGSMVEEAEKNTDLIATAPDMFLALVMVIDTISFQFMEQQIQDMVSAAIARATGAQP